MKTNKVKAVDMVRQIRDQQYEEIKGMNNVQKQTYYRQKAQSLIAQLQSLIEKFRQKIVTA